MHPDAGKASASYDTAMMVCSPELNYEFGSMQTNLNTLKPKLYSNFGRYVLCLQPYSSWYPLCVRQHHLLSINEMFVWVESPHRKLFFRNHNTAFIVRPLSCTHNPMIQRLLKETVCYRHVTGGNKRSNLSAQSVFWPNRKSMNFC